MAPITDRFWARIDVADDNECWPWTGSRNKQGYGVLRFNGRRTLAHRIAYEIMVESISPGLCVLHRCDNPPCCNPAHLFLGTRSDNAADRHAKGRDRGGPPSGERNHKAKLTDAQRLEVIAALNAGESRAELARRYGVTWESIEGIRLRASARKTMSPRRATGERNGNASLSNAQRAEILERAAQGESRADLARRYGVSWTAINYVLKVKV